MIVERVVHHAAAIWRLQPSSIIGRQKLQLVVQPRQAVMFVAVKELGISTTRVGAALNRDHTSVIHGCDVAHQRMFRDPEYMANVVELTRRSQERGEFILPSANRKALRAELAVAADFAIESLLDLYNVDPEGFRALMEDVMRGNLQRRVAALVPDRKAS